jgi:hypothetical protein
MANGWPAVPNGGSHGVGSTRPDSRWQATAGTGFDRAHGSIEGGTHQATSPQGQHSSRVSQAGERMDIVCATGTCAACPVRQDGTRSQAVRGMGMRRSRSDGLARTHVQHVLTAVAITLVHMDAVLTQAIRGTTRRSHCAHVSSMPAIPERIGA